MRSQSPIKWIGGKFFLAEEICKRLDYTKKCYIELFGGGAQVLFRKKPHKIEIYNDIDKELVNFFVVLKTKHFRLKEELEKLPYSRVLFKKMFEEKQKENVSRFGNLKQAVRFYYLVRSQFSSKINTKDCGWEFGYFKNSASVFYKSLDLLDHAQQRMKNIQIECRDFRKILDSLLKNKSDKNTMIYADPPYLSKEHYYQGAFSIQDHIDLASYLNKVKSSVMISYYMFDNDNISLKQLYPEPKWKYHMFEVAKHSQKVVRFEQKPRAQEYLILNYDFSSTLFDEEIL